MLYEPAAPFKTYERFPRIALPAPRPVTLPLQDAIDSRASAESFSAKPLRLAAFSDLLSQLAVHPTRTQPENPVPMRRQPSGGGLYPLEAYVAIRRVEGITSGLYHYEPREHELRELLHHDRIDDFTAVMKPYLLEQFCDPAAILILTSVWGRNYPKYGEFAYRLALLEAGHAMQNLLLAASALNLAARPIAGFAYDTMVEILDIKEEAEDPLYALLIGA